jgi:GGDEF domain-containing protein
VGVTVARPGDPADASPDAVVARADAAMYRAKRSAAGGVRRPSA